MPTLTIADIKAAAGKIGATVRDVTAIRRAPSYDIHAPEGQAWACESDPGYHVLSVWWLTDYGPDYEQEVLSKTLGWMAEGLKPCQDAECRYCRPKAEPVMIDYQI